MSYGLEIWNSLGEKTLTITDRPCRIHGTVTIPALASNASTNISVTGMANDGTWFYHHSAGIKYQVTFGAGFMTVKNTHLYATGSATMILYRA